MKGKTWRVALALVAFLIGATDANAPLVDAAKRGDADAVRALLAEGADVDARAGDGATALLWASYNDDLEIAGLLIDSGADVGLSNDLGATPVWAASRNGSTAMAEMLLEAGADSDASLLLGETALITASRSGNPDVVRLLLDHGAEVDARGARGQTALMFAAAERHPEVVRVLLEHGADLNARSHVWNQLMAQSPHAHPEHQAWVLHGGNTALLFAARAGDLESVRLLVHAGADVNVESAWGFTPLAIAAYADIGEWFVIQEETNDRFVYFETDDILPGDYGEIVTLLLEEGADPNGGAHRFTPLIAAVMRENEDGVRQLLAHGADPNLALGDFTPHQRGSSTDFSFHKSWVGASPLWLAARFSTPEVVRELLSHGADPRFVHHGVYYGGRPGGNLSQRRDEVATTLMAAVALAGNNGREWTPIERDEAAVLEVVRLLVDAGADVGALDPRGRSALDGATDLGYPAVVDYLVSRGAVRGAASSGGD